MVNKFMKKEKLEDEVATSGDVEVREMLRQEHHPEGGEVVAEEEAMTVIQRRRNNTVNKISEEQRIREERQGSPMEAAGQPAAAMPQATKPIPGQICQVNGRVFNQRGEEMLTGEEWLLRQRLEGKSLINRGAIERAFLDRDEMEAIITGYGTVFHLAPDCGKLKCSTSRKSYRMCEDCRFRKRQEVVRVEYRGLGPTTNPVSGTPGATSSTG